ncbi:hypothetical protein ACFFK0_09920 [Paenibacillus chartarius]|uniref:Uncharacterized protein n=1 Tax=Paenibacillus chartarius TaxID=747481 RepID=A0ABV6DJL1_9BACL
MGKREQIVQLIHDSGLGRIKHTLVNLLVDSIRAKPEICNDEEILIGESKLGGRPDVPTNLGGLPLRTIPSISLLKKKLIQ